MLKVGDHVRLNKKYRIFKEGYLPGWTEEVFVVAQVRPGVVPTYKINEWGGTPEWYVLCPGFAKSYQDGRQSVLGGEDCQT